MPRPNPYHLKTLRHWKRMWKRNPEEMEATRQEATKSAAMTYQLRREKVADTIKAWPPEMTNTQLKERVLLKATEMGYQPRSLKVKARRLGLIAYDPKRRVWINRCV